MIMLLAKYIRIPLSVFLLSVKSGVHWRRGKSLGR